MCYLYSPTWSHFTFHDVADHLPLFQHKGKLIKYPEKEFASMPRCLSVTQNASVCHMITAHVPVGSVIFPCPGYILASNISVTFWLAIVGGRSVIFPYQGCIFASEISVRFWSAMQSQSSFHIQALS